MSMTMICIKNELYKIFRAVKYRLFMGILAVLTVCIFISGAISGNPVSFFSENYPYFVLSLCCYLLIPFATFSLAADLISGEYERNEMKLLLTRHITRNELIIGKLASIAVYDMLLMAVNVLSAAVLTVIFCGVASVNLITVFVSVLTTFLPAVTVTAFAGMIAVICKTSISAFAAEMAAYALISVISLVFSHISRAFFTSYLAIYKMTIGQSIPVFEMIMGAAVLVGSILLFIPTACLIFEKKNI